MLKFLVWCWDRQDANYPKIRFATRWDSRDRDGSSCVKILRCKAPHVPRHRHTQTHWKTDLIWTPNLYESCVKFVAKKQPGLSWIRISQSPILWASQTINWVVIDSRLLGLCQSVVWFDTWVLQAMSAPPKIRFRVTHCSSHQGFSRCVAN